MKSHLLCEVLIFACFDIETVKIVTRHVSIRKASGHTTAKSAIARPDATVSGLFNKPKRSGHPKSKTTFTDIDEKLNVRGFSNSRLLHRGFQFLGGEESFSATL